MVDEVVPSALRGPARAAVERALRTAPRPRFTPIVIGLLVATLVTNASYVATLFWMERPPDGYVTFWDGWVYAISTLLPVLLLVARAVQDADRRWAWLLVAGGTLATWIADLLYTYHDQNMAAFDVPAWSDLAYLAAYPLWAAGIVTLAFWSVPGLRRAAMLDGFIVGLTVGAVAVIVWFEPIFSQSGSRGEVRLATLFAVCDLMLLVVAIATLAPQRYRPSPAGLGFVLAAASFAVGDIVYLSVISNEDYVPGTVLDVWWSVGVVLFGLAAWLPSTTRRHDPQSLAETLGVVPAVAAIGALGLLTAALNRDVPTLAEGMAVAAVALALVRVLWTMRELRKLNESYQQARTDDLTGLGNRRAFLESIVAVLAEPPRSGASTATLLMVDLDGFKEVNDSLGHPAGDVLLVEVGARFRAALGSAAHLARLGGDEFGLVGAWTVEEATIVAHDLLRTLRDPVVVEGVPVRVAASVGLAATALGGAAVAREELLRMADVAMYDAKRRGTRVARYDEAEDPHGRDRLQFLDDLCTAIDEHGFAIQVQPVVDAFAGSVTSGEVLIRWHHEVRGTVVPDEFIPLAERVGVIPRITRLVIGDAAALAARLRDEGLDLGLSVNISGRDLVDEDLADHVLGALADAGIPPDQLTLEITETALAGDPVRSARTLTALRHRGVRISIDDFGVGYASLAQLLAFPLDELKLDRSFIALVEEDRRAQAIVRSAVELGRALGLTVVAEGVESETALRVVRGLGVDRVQGFHVSVPLDPEAFIAFAAARTVARGAGADR